MNNSNGKTRRLAGLALFTAIVVVLQLLGSFIKVGPFAVSLVLIPIVVGAAVYGVSAGAWLGFVFGVVVTIAVVTGADQGGYIMFSARPVMTVLVCLIKGTAAGYVAGLLYRAIALRVSINKTSTYYAECVFFAVHFFFYIINPIIRSVTNTAAQANSATVRRLFSLYAAIKAIISPASPDRIPPAVAVRMAGKVIAARQAYGT